MMKIHRPTVAPAKKVHVLRHIEKVCDLDLEIEVMPTMSRDEAIIPQRLPALLLA